MKYMRKIWIPMISMLCVLCFCNIVSCAAEERLKTPYLNNADAQDDDVTIRFTEGSDKQTQGGRWTYVEGKWVYIRQDAVFVKADGYEIWRSENDQEEYVLVKDMNATEVANSSKVEADFNNEVFITYVDKNLEWGKKYTYKIRAYKLDATQEGGKLYSYFSNTETVRLYVRGSKNPEFYGIETYLNAVRLLVPYAGSDVSFDNDGKEEEDDYFSGWYPNRLSKYTGIEIWRKQEGVESSYRKIKTVKAEPYVVIDGDGYAVLDENLKWGATYSYRIRSYRVDAEAPGGKWYSDFVTPKDATGTVTIKKVQVGKLRTVGKKNAVSIMWDELVNDEIAGYVIYRANSLNGSYKRIAKMGINNSYSTFDGKKTKNYFIYTDTKLRASKRYYYKVAAYTKADSEEKGDVTIFSLKSPGASGKPNAKYKEGTIPELADPGLSAVKIKSASNPSAGKIKLSWGKVANAKGYVIYASDRKDGVYEEVKVIKNAKTCSATLKAETGKTCYYKVVAYAMVAKQRVCGEESSAKKVTCKK